MSKENKVYVPLVLCSYRNFNKPDGIKVSIDSLSDETDKIIKDCTYSMGYTKFNCRANGCKDLESVSTVGVLFFLCEEEAVDKLIEYRKNYHERICQAMDDFGKAHSAELSSIDNSQKESSEEVWERYQNLSKSFPIDLYNYVKENLDGKFLQTAFITFFLDKYRTSEKSDTVCNDISKGFINLEEFINKAKEVGYSIECNGVPVDISNPLDYILNALSSEKDSGHIELVSHLSKDVEAPKKPMTFFIPQKFALF